MVCHPLKGLRQEWRRAASARTGHPSSSSSARLRPISFTWKEDGTRDLGLGAEEVARVEPLLTFRNKRGQIEGVKYNQVSAVLINAVKEQQQQIHELQRQLASLKSRIIKHHRPFSHL